MSARKDGAVIISVTELIMFNYVTRDSSTTNFRRLYFSLILVEKILACQKANQAAVSVFFTYLAFSVV